MLQVIRLTLKGNILFSFHCSPVSTFDHKGPDTIDRVNLNLHIPDKTEIVLKVAINAITWTLT
jgi:hypothetical protein